MAASFFVRLFSALMIFCFSGAAYAEEISADISKAAEIQKRISNTGFKLLNANKIDKRMIFVYSKDEDKPKFIDKSIIKKEAVIFDRKLAFVSDDNELAALLSLGIGKTINSYTGFFTAIQAKLAPKKFEILFDKKAVDFMTKAGYNPIALITYMNKAFPQKRGIIGCLRSNAVSKREANIYEYIYTNYPYYLKNNPYFYTEAYQNFLLTSAANRAMLINKIESGSTKTLKYE